MKIAPKFKFDLDYKVSPKVIIIALSVVLCALLLVVAVRNIPREISLLEYDNFLQSRSIQSAEISGEKLVFHAGGKNYYVLKDSINLNELAQTVAIKAPSEYGEDLFLLVLLAACGFMVFVILRRRQSFAVSATQTAQNDLEGAVSGAQIVPAISNVRFGDVAGIDEVKFELMEIVDFLKNPSKYRDFGIRVPKGVLMIGPPGVGKTLVAKAVAGEAGVPFFYQSGASFVQIYVGMGAKRVRELFSKAKAYAPSIVFIDEIDAVGKARGGGRNDEREATLNQLLTEMDGFTDNSGVIVIAATNKIEMIDEALLRSGRFDRRVFLSLPDASDRAAILQTYLRGKKCAANVQNIAQNTTGFSGAGLATLVNEAAINALREGRETITDADFAAVEGKVLHGKRKFYSLSREEKEIQALYKAAKALAAEWFGVNFDKISLLEDRFLLSDDFLESKTALLARIKVALAGAAALKVYKNELFTNAANDVAEARELAKSLVVDYAMSGGLLGSNSDIKDVLDGCESEVEEFVKGCERSLLAVQDYLARKESVTREELAQIIKESYES